MRTLNQHHQQRPLKQGGIYSLNLGQNNGPNLPKNENDIYGQKLQQDQVGTRSISSLLAKAGQQQLASNHLMEPPEIYDDSLKQFTNYDERYKSKLSASDNLTTASAYQEVLIKKLQSELREYKSSIENLEEELKQMNEQINTDNITNIKELQPMLKEFHTRLKDSLGEEKNLNYILQRELEYLNREKLQIQQSVLFSHKRIMELEKIVGVQRQNKPEFQQEEAIDEEEQDDNRNNENDDDSYQD